MSYSEVEAMIGVTLKPCPFCGCSIPGIYLGPNPHVTCPKCKADGPLVFGKKEDLFIRQRMAAQKWNERVVR